MNAPSDLVTSLQLQISSPSSPAITTDDMDNNDTPLSTKAVCDRQQSVLTRMTLLSLMQRGETT